VNKHFKIISDLVDQIETDLSEEINIEGLAEKFELSPWHFQRLFKGMVGDSLGAYIRGRRLSIAAEELAKTDRLVIDIALDAGFNSHEAFSRSFKTIYKLTPKEFREFKPSVSLYHKPVLTNDLLKHISTGIKKDPEIINFPATRVIGHVIDIPSPFRIEGLYCNYLADSWFPLLKKFNYLEVSIPNTVFGIYMSPSGTFTEETFQYVAGVPVKDLSSTPDGFKAFEMPGKKYALFDMIDSSDGTLAKTIDYVYGYWLPNSNFQRDDGFDFEYFQNIHVISEKEVRDGGTSKYAIPIR
jgi:AraC family transcriptional regulator